MPRQAPELVLEETRMQRDRIHAGLFKETHPLHESRLPVGAAFAQADLHGQHARPVLASVAHDAAQRIEILKQRASRLSGPHRLGVASEVEVHRVRSLGAFFPGRACHARIRSGHAIVRPGRACHARIRSGGSQCGYGASRRRTEGASDS